MTSDRLRALATVTAHDVALGRIVEGHVDAVAILAEAGVQPPVGSRLGVWAAGPPGEVVAEPTAGGFTLSGTRRWCSGASFLTHAVLVASLLGGRQLFLVDLSRPGIEADSGSWRAVGMARSDTLDVTFSDVLVDQACQVGGGNWYLERAGFWQGSIGVAACWWGGATGVAAALEATPARLTLIGMLIAELSPPGCGHCVSPWWPQPPTSMLIPSTRRVSLARLRSPSAISWSKAARR